MIAMSFFDRWIWPAGGSGGIPGDVVGTLVWVVIAAIVTILVWPPLRHAIEDFAKRHVETIKEHVGTENAEIHRKLDHVIKHSNIPPLPPKESK